MPLSNQRLLLCSMAHFLFIYPQFFDSPLKTLNKYLRYFAYELAKFTNIGPRMSRMERKRNNGETSENNINGFYSDSFTTFFQSF
jgi:hypothetical protein